jgi:kynureninase
VPALYAATAGYDVIEEIGVDAIRERSLGLTSLLIELLGVAGFEVSSPRAPERRGGTVLVRTPDDAAVHKELGERGILCDFRPEAGIRLGPHFYNSEEELRHTVLELTDIVANGAYARHAGAAARF